MSSLKDKVAIITGASSGIGEEIAYYFASNGSKLSLIGRNKERLESVVANCLKEGMQNENVIYIAGDLTNGDVRKALVDNTLSTFGKIDILINNAGIATIGICADTSEEDYRRVVETNQNMPFLLTQLAIPYLKQSKEMARHGVRVNSVSPGFVETGIRRDLSVDQDQLQTIYAEEEKRTPLGRNGTSREIAETVGFLASDNASWITGEDLIIDGGRHVVCRNPYLSDVKYKQ